MDQHSFAVYVAVVYFLLFSSLVVHEFAHVYAAQYVTKDCMFTESELRFDILLVRRSGMTYLTCSHGVERLPSPNVSLIWDDFTLPVVRVKVAEASGVRLIGSPLSTGWFTALFGPAAEVVYLAVATDWLSKTFKRLVNLRVFFPPLLLVAFWSARLDLIQAVPPHNLGFFVSAYVATYFTIVLLHLSLNVDYYRRLFGSGTN